MDDIKITSLIDLKTYFNISLLIHYRVRTVIFMLLPFVVIQYSISTTSFSWVNETIFIALYLGFYAGMVPLRIYFSCKQNMKKSAYLRETIQYTIDAEKVECKGDSVSATSSWQHITKLIEREDYFLLMVSAGSFHYLPKAGFESKEDIARLKNLVREMGIKMTYH